eukprot:m.79575 g.79575  ORF g.79575 m.79575 type:complete len:339 (-) comp11982_c1_seq1:68-1084(-)
MSDTMDEKSLFEHQCPWPTYSFGFSFNKETPFRVAVGSFVEEYSNKIQVLDLNSEKGEYEVHSTIEHPYPTTKIMWIPDSDDDRPELFATTGDYLRLWKVEQEDGKNRTSVEVLLNNNKHSEFCAPLTSFDWNTVDPSQIVTTSIDTTCTVWDLVAQKSKGRAVGSVKAQIIAHDQEVYDVAFSNNTNIFTSVSADASVRMFDLRDLEHSAIVYEEEKSMPLLRIACNKQDPNYLAVTKIDSNEIVLLDVRMPCVPAATMKSHMGPVNSVQWAPHSSAHLTSAGDDKKTYIWEVKGKNIAEPILAYDATAPVNQVHWSSAETNWVGITFEDKFQVLRL